MWLFERSTRIKFSATGQDNSPQSPTISYRQPLAVSLLMTLNQLDNSKSNEKIKTYEITNFTFSYTFFLQ